MRIARLALVLFAMGFLSTAIFSTAAHADPVKCRAAIGKNAAAFAQAKMKLLQKCSEGLAKKGLLTTACPDTKTDGKIGKAESKAQAGVVKACGGKDKVCGTGDDDSLASIGWDTTTTCPNFETSDCTNAIAPLGNCADIGSCLTCVGERVVDQAIGLYYGSLNPTDPKVSKANKALNKCQLAIGKGAAGFFAAKTKALQKCWDTVNKGKATGPCPPFGAGDGKADAAIAKAKTKVDAAICKACGGADKACDGVNDILPSAIGFPDCPPVTAPGTVPAPCAGTVLTLAELRDCVDCVTEFKADCLSLAAATGFPNAPAYPSECNVVLPPTPTRTATPVPTVTSTPVPTITATTTAGPATATPTKTTTPVLTATATVGPTATPTVVASPSCPTQVTFTGTSSNGVLDTGWTGQGHDATVISDGTATVSVTSCAGAAPTCGVCSYTGPIDNTGTNQLDSSRCSNDSSIHCTPGNNAPCTGGGGTCKFYFGSYLPLAAGGVSTCVENTFNGGITGTANMQTGTSAGTASVTSRVFSGPTLSNPCARCLGDGTANDGVQGGTCNGGPRDGLLCDRSGSSPNAAFGPTSLDCPQASGGVIATLPIDLSNTTGTKTRTLSAANPNCRAIGFTTLKCQCDTCNNGAATPCSNNADCTAVGATICGGKRCSGGANNGAACVNNTECPGGACNVPGQATAPNQCDDGVCDPDPGTPGPNDGICNGGPFEQFCSPVETFRGCLNNTDCTFAGDTCTLGKFRDCFDSGGIGEVVTATGNADPPSGHQSDPTLAALFCIGPTASGAVNAAAGLPGLGRLELTGHATDNGTP